MKSKKLIVRLLIISGLAIFVSCSGGATKNESFTNEIKNEFYQIECADHKSRFKTTTLNCFLEFAKNKSQTTEEKKRKI